MINKSLGSFDIRQAVQDGYRDVKLFVIFQPDQTPASGAVACEAALGIIGEIQVIDHTQKHIATKLPTAESARAVETRGVW